MNLFIFSWMKDGHDEVSDKQKTKTLGFFVTSNADSASHFRFAR
jgi:hypothetical protein